MSRTKKSRKPGSAPTAKPKLSKVELANVEKRVRKKTGKKPGNRQQEAKQDNSLAQNTNQNKDPRIGSKKPIDLGVATKALKPTSSKNIKAKSDPIAAIRPVNNEVEEAEVVQVSLTQELANIEADEQLQKILAKQEDELALTEQEVDYFNDMMERHQQLSEQLDQDGTEEENKQTASSEDDLWDKLDNSSSFDFPLDSDQD